MLLLSCLWEGVLLECDTEQIDRVIQTSLKEERQSVFQNWAEGIINKDWVTCDTCPILLIHTLSKGSEHRLKLSEWHKHVLSIYKDESELLKDMLQTQQNPFQREQLKLKKPELDEWKALKLHDYFYQEFKNNNLIDAT